MEPQALIDYLHGALGKSYTRGEAILDILLAGMRKEADCLTRRECEFLVRSVSPFIKDPRDVEHVMTLMRGGQVPQVDAFRATNTVPKGAHGG